MGLIKNENYVHIEGWMINELQLKGNDLLVYAIIYGFSQDGESKFTGSLQYLADWCNATKQGIQKNLSNLLNKGIISKTESTKNNIKYCEYSCIPYNSVAYPIQHSCINNIDNTIGNNIYSSKEEYIEEKSDFESHAYTKEDFIGSARRKPKKEPVERKKSLYEKCIDEINSYTNDAILQNMLTEYLQIRLKMKEKPIYGIAQWTGMLNKLAQIGDNYKQREVVKTSIERGWASFFDSKSSMFNKDVSSEFGTVVCEHSETTADERAENLKNKGRRTTF